MVDFDAMLAETKRLQKIEELAEELQRLNSTMRIGRDGQQQFDFCEVCGEVSTTSECRNHNCPDFQLRELLKQGEK